MYVVRITYFSNIPWTFQGNFIKKRFTFFKGDCLYASVDNSEKYFQLFIVELW